jgi:uncharacterized protein YqgC (DUF456 family)
VNTLLIVLCAVAMVVGVIGVVVPVLPGLFLCLAAVLAWALFDDGPTRTRWIVFALCAVWVLLGTVVKYAWPGAKMKASGVPARTLLAGVVLGVILMFPIPVVGLLIGFVGGVWLAEAMRLGGFGPAWPSTVAALRAAGLSVLVELGAACLVAATWVVGLILV